MFINTLVCNVSIESGKEDCKNNIVYDDIIAKRG